MDFIFLTVIVIMDLGVHMKVWAHSPVNPNVFIGRTDAEAETPVLWPPHAMS